MSAENGVRWSSLIRDAGLASGWSGPADPLITSVVEDSRQAGPGACFVAVRGGKVDGHAYVERALAAGACAVITERAVPVPEGVAAWQVASARGVAGRLAAVLYGVNRLQREGRLELIGVTGTNGKSTFCFMVRAILQAAECPTALFGTIEYDVISRKIAASMTTPPAATLVEYLAEAAKAGATHAVMEVSSHALDQGRCDGLRFDVGVFSNLTGDHLDYHKDMPSYLRAKKRLFDGLGPEAVAVVNQEDPAWARMVADCPARVMRYAVAENRDPEGLRGASLLARITEMSVAGTRFELVVRGAAAGSDATVESSEVVSPLIGRHNVQNSLAAAGAALAVGIPLSKVVAGLESVRCVPGRLQRVEVPGVGGEAAAGLGITVLVDYAHTDDALKNVLSALQPLTTAAGRRLIVLFGCGGDRDRTKRPRMAREAARWADRIVVTSDNPRTEGPIRIIQEIMTGFAPQERRKVHVEPDRRRAIVAAIAMAEPGDIVLLAGKGHENYQEIGHTRIEFDDAVVAAEVLRSRMSGKRRMGSGQRSAGNPAASGVLALSSR